MKTESEKIKVLDDNNIKYVIKRGNYVRLSLRIKDNQVIINLPFLLPLEVAEDFVSKHIDYVKKHLVNKEFFCEYKDGGKYLLFGTYYYICSSQKINYIDLTNQLILVKSNEENKIIKDVNKLVLELASKLYRKVLNDSLELMKKDIQENPILVIKSSKRNWGYCKYKENLVMLNISLIHAPMKYLKYVACHELCHFRYHDHSKGFHALLQKYVPDERKLKKELSKYPIIY